LTDEQSENLIAERAIAERDAVESRESLDIAQRELENSREVVTAILATLALTERELEKLKSEIHELRAELAWRRNYTPTWERKR